MERVVLGQESTCPQEKMASKASLGSVGTSMWTTVSTSRLERLRITGYPVDSIDLSSTMRITGYPVNSIDLSATRHSQTSLDVSTILQDSSMEDTRLPASPRHSSPRKGQRRARPASPPGQDVSPPGQDLSPFTRPTSQAISEAVAGVLDMSQDSYALYAPQNTPNTTAESCHAMIVNCTAADFDCRVLGPRPQCIGREAEPLSMETRADHSPRGSSLRRHCGHTTLSPHDTAVHPRPVYSSPDSHGRPSPHHTAVHPSPVYSSPGSHGRPSPRDRRLHTTVDSDATFFMSNPLVHPAVTKRKSSHSKRRQIIRKLKKFGRHLHGAASGPMETLAIV